MNAAEVLNEVRQCGIRLHVNGSDLCYAAPQGALTADLKAELKANKPQLLTILSNNKHRRQGDRLYPYRFKLRDGGGTYLTPAKTLGEAKAALQRRYGEDLLLVTTGRVACPES